MHSFCVLMALFHLYLIPNTLYFVFLFVVFRKPHTLNKPPRNHHPRPQAAVATKLAIQVSLEAHEQAIIVRVKRDL
jgi:hypothetical protein